MLNHASTLLLVALLALAGCGQNPASPGEDSPSPTPAFREVALGTMPRSESLGQRGQSAAALAGGGFAVVWDVGRFPEVDVAMQWLAADGSTLFEQGGRLVAAGPTREADSVVAAHPASGAFVAFIRDVGGNRGQVFVQSFDGNGQPRWPFEGVAAASRLGSETQTTPTLVADAVGGAFVCFQAVQGPQDGIRCQHLDSGGQRSWAAAGLHAGGVSGSRVLPRGVADGRGGLLVFWLNQRDIGRPGDPMLMEGQRFTADGTRHWGSARVVRQTGRAFGGGYGPREFGVVADGRNGAVLAFNDWTRLADSSLDVVAQRVDGDGNLLWGDGAVVTAAVGSQQHADTIAAPDGGAFVAVDEHSGGNTSRTSLYHLGPDGRHRWGATGQLLSDPAATARAYGTIGVHDGRRLHAFWTHQADPSSDMDVRGARFAPDGSRLDGAAGVLASGAPGGQFARQVVVSPTTGRLLVVWDDWRRGGADQGDVYGALVTDGSR